MRIRKSGSKSPTACPVVEKHTAFIVEFEYLIFKSYLAVALPIALGIAGAQTPEGKMEFEVASVKLSQGAFTPPNFPLDEGNAYRETGGRFSANFPVTVYIQFAYKTRLTQDQMQAALARLPKWVSNERFVIEAKAAKANPTKDQMRLMMQSLLADRFQLRIHFETPETPVLAMTLAKPGQTGPKLRPHSEGPPCDSNAQVFPPVCDVVSLTRQAGRNLAGSRNTTMDLLAATLPSLGEMGRPVVDRTGLTGKMDFTLEWMPEGAQPDLQGTTFLQALREQLGLKLDSARAPVRTYVIDRIERPSEN